MRLRLASNSVPLGQRSGWGSTWMRVNTEGAGEGAGSLPPSWAERLSMRWPAGAWRTRASTRRAANGVVAWLRASVVWRSSVQRLRSASMLPSPSPSAQALQHVGHILHRAQEGELRARQQQEAELANPACANGGEGRRSWRGLAGSRQSD